MIPRFWFALVAVVLGGAVGVCADPPRPSADRVRATIKQLWSNKPNELDVAYKTLEADPLALPVLRVAAATDPDVGHRGVLEQLLAKALTGRDKQVAKLVDQWAKDGRLDLLTEVRSLTDGPAAEAALGGLLKATQTLGQSGGELLAKQSQKAAARFRPGPPWGDGAAFQKDGPKPLFDTEVNEPEQRRRAMIARFADRVTLPTADLDRAVLVCRSHLDTLSTNPGYVGRSEWNQCLVCVNAPLTLDTPTASVVVVDGDVALTAVRIPPHPQYSVIVANGNVTLAPKTDLPLIEMSVVWATGDIDLPAKSGVYFSELLASGKVANADEPGFKGAVTQNVKEPPLPVRFLDPAADYGLTLEAGKDGMTVSKVADKSAFTEFLKAGDVIAAVTGVKTPTAPAFRRELRRGIIEGAVLLDVVRGKEKLELLVPVPDVPAAPKKEKKDDPKAKPVEK